METKVILVFLLFLFPTGIMAQFEIKGNILNSQNSEPLPFTTIRIQGTNMGTISNEDGYFELQAHFENTDSVAFSMLSFKTRGLPLQFFKDSSVVYLTPKVYTLKTVNIKPLDEAKLFQDLTVLLKSYRKNTETSTAKAYFKLQTSLNNEPIEMIEALYNVTGSVKNGPLSTALKMGRFGQAKHHKFYSLNTSNQLVSLNLFQKNGDEVFPAWCGNLNLNKLEKFYEISGFTQYESGYILTLHPKTDGLFQVVIAVSSSSNTIENLLLTAYDANLKGYVSLQQKDNLDFEKIQIEVKYVPDRNLINFISIDQEFKYGHGVDDFRHYHTKVDLLMFDYGALFLDPQKFSTVELSDDYAKIISYGFSPEFWRNNNTIAFSKQTQSDFNELIATGDVVFFDTGTVSDRIKTSIKYPLLEITPTSKITWKDFGRNSEQFNIDRADQKLISGSYTRSNFYNLTFSMVANPLRINDTLKINSKVFFDKNQSYFHLKKDSLLLMSIDSIKQRIVLLKNEFDREVYPEIPSLIESIKKFDGKMKELSRKVYLFEPKVVTSDVVIKKDSASICYNMALSFQTAREYDNALRYYKKAIDFESDNINLLKDLYYNRSLIYWELDQKSKACSDLEKSSMLGDQSAKEKLKIRCKP